MRTIVTLCPQFVTKSVHVTLGKTTPGLIKPPNRCDSTVLSVLVKLGSFLPKHNPKVQMTELIYLHVCGLLGISQL